MNERGLAFPCGRNNAPLPAQRYRPVGCDRPDLIADFVHVSDEDRARPSRSGLDHDVADVVDDRALLRPGRQ